MIETAFGGLDPQAMVVLVVALIGTVPIVLYRKRTDTWFIVAFGCLLTAAIATNAENVILPDVLNLTEHVVGNMGAGVAFAVAAYLYRVRESAALESQAEGSR